IERHVITEEEAGKRLDKVFHNMMETYSRQKVQKFIKEGYVKVNNLVCKPSYICDVNDVISWCIPESKEDKEIMPENIPLTILYEDDDLLIVNKPKGMLVHPTNTVKKYTLVNALKYHCETLSDLN